MDIVRQRLATQRLTGTPFASVGTAVQRLGAVQAQDYPAAKWGLAQRIRGGLTSRQFDEAFAAGKILRTHIMRPTWHFVMPEDIRWLQELTAPRVRMLMARFDATLELDDGTIRHSQDLFGQALQGGTWLTRAELAEVLRQGGLKAAGMRLGHLIMYAELAGVLCSGGLKGKQHTYALVVERAPQAKRLERDEALAELAHRYFSGHGPATAQDLAWWSGLTLADVKHGLELAKKQLTQEASDGQVYWFAATQPKPVHKPSLHLLPNYDEFLIGYKGYGAILKAPHLAPTASDPLRAHIIIRDGRPVGSWKRTLSKNRVTIKPEVLVKLSKAEQTALQTAAEAYGAFLELPVAVEA